MIDNSNFPLPSNRKFGYTFSFIFFFFSIYFFLNNIFFYNYFFLSVSILCFIITFVKSEVLYPLNKLWMRFGLLLGKIINPIIMGLIFFIIFTPVSIFMKLIGRDELRLDFNTRKSNWRIRNKDLNNETDFEKQF